MRQRIENITTPKSPNTSIIKNIDVDIEKYENEAKKMLARMELTLKDLRQLNTESDPNKRFEVFFLTFLLLSILYKFYTIF
jgi:hypothetical protein